MKKNLLTIFFSGDDFNLIEWSEKLSFFKTFVLSEKGSEIKIGEKQLPAASFSVLQANVEIEGNIETALFDTAEKLATIFRISDSFPIDSVDFILRIKNIDFLDFGIIQEIFHVHPEIQVTFKVAVEVNTEIIITDARQNTDTQVGKLQRKQRVPRRLIRNMLAHAKFVSQTDHHTFTIVTSGTKKSIISSDKVSSWRTASKTQPR